MNNRYLYSIHNKQAIYNSTECACYYCFKKMHPKDIIEYCLDYDSTIKNYVQDTALCPYCNIDSILPNSLVDYDNQLLHELHAFVWNNHI